MTKIPKPTVPKKPNDLILKEESVNELNQFLGITQNAEKFNLVNYKSAYHNLVNMLNKNLKKID